MADLPNEIPSMKLNDGTSIPMLAFGTGTAWYKRSEGNIDKDLVKSIKTAIQMGYHHLDAAEVYNTEREVGIAIKESGVPREKLFVTTKAFRKIGDIPAAIEQSLKKLQLDYVDLYLIHSPFFAASPSDLQTAWHAMESVKSTGKALSIGVSNYLSHHLETTLSTATTPPSINQIEFHPYLQHKPTTTTPSPSPSDDNNNNNNSNTSLLTYMKSHNIAAAAYAPLTPLTKAKPGPCDELLAALAKKYFVGEAEILLRWCMEQGVVAVTTSGKEERMSDYLRCAAFRLTPREVEDLSTLGEGKHFRGFFNQKFGEGDRS